MRTTESVLEMSIPSSAFGPTSSPKPTNSIAGVIGVPTSLRETAAMPRNASDTMTRAHSIGDIMAVPAAPREAQPRRLAQPPEQLCRAGRSSGAREDGDGDQRSGSDGDHDLRLSAQLRHVFDQPLSLGRDLQPDLFSAAF